MNKKLSFYSFETIRNILFYAVIIIFVFSLIPIFIISAYNHPSADDYSYAASTHTVLVNSGSLIELAKAIFEQVGGIYFSWQGTFSGIFLFIFQPALFGDNLYFLTTIIMVASFTGANLFFSYSLFVRALKIHLKTWIFTSLLITGISMQFLNSPVQGFFYYNGAIYYTFFYSLSLVLFGLILHILTNDQSGNNKKLSAVSIALAFFIGGGNLVTALITCILTFSIWATLRYLNHNQSKTIFPNFLACLLALTLSALAPGHAVRRSYSVEMPVVLAVFNSVIEAGKFIITQPTTIPILLTTTLFVPFLMKDVLKLKFYFPRPLLVLMLSFSVFAAHFTPTLYASSQAGPGRLQNLYTYALIWFFILNSCYMTGWFYYRLEQKYSHSPIKNKLPALFSKLLPPTVILLIVVFFGVVTTSEYVSSTTSVSAAQSLLSGEARQYDREYDARLDVLNSSELNVSIPPIKTKPHVLFFMDIKDPPNSNNRGLIAFYQKETITLIGP